MKLHVKLLLLFLLLPMITLASTVQALDYQDPSAVVLLVTPLITLASVWAIKKLSPFISGTITLLVVAALSAVLAWLSGVITGDSSWLLQFLVGLASVFLHQLYENFNKKEA